MDAQRTRLIVNFLNYFLRMMLAVRQGPFFVLIRERGPALADAKHHNRSMKLKLYYILCAAVDIIETHNVIFAKVRPTLHFD